MHSSRGSCENQQQRRVDNCSSKALVANNDVEVIGYAPTRVRKEGLEPFNVDAATYPCNININGEGVVSTVCALRAQDVPR